MKFFRPSVELAKAGFCAHQQGKFWDYFKHVYGNTFSSTYRTTDELINYVAKKIGLSEKPLKECIRDKKTHAKVMESRAEAASYGVSSTPSYFINGSPEERNLSKEMLDSLL